MAGLDRHGRLNQLRTLNLVFRFAQLSAPERVDVANWGIVESCSGEQVQD